MCQFSGRRRPQILGSWSVIMYLQYHLIHGGWQVPSVRLWTRADETTTGGNMARTAMTHAQIQTTQERWVGTREVALHLGKPTSWIYDNVIRRGIPHRKVGNQYRFRLSEIDKWMDGRS
ncbi:helix-turn-helix domain-containing protein [Sphaerisporangium dianthi]|uniref:Helix-turn-helix domain-containing protein n=1 Tax=Sphaerisporangium dianthi TaxID=1436120 RepID=A0ABV9CTN0_9ACTN